METEPEQTGLSASYNGVGQGASPRDIYRLVNDCAAVVHGSCGVRGENEVCGIKLRQLLDDLETVLSDSEAYQYTVLAASVCLPEQNQPWRYHPLLDTSLLRAGLLTLFRFAPVPLHDHPGACGVQKVLSGKVRVGSYDFGHQTEGSRHLVRLDQRATREITAGESTCYHRQSGNLHELASIAPRSVLLSLTFRPHQPQQRYWYFPAHGLPAGNQTLFNRLRKPTRLGDRRLVERF